METTFPAADAALPGALLERAKRVRLLTCDVDGVLTDGKLYYAENGMELKAFSAADGLGLQLLQKSGVAIGFITGSRSSAVERRAQVLGIEHVVLDAHDKLAAWKDLQRRLNIAAVECAHIGDDLPDLPVLVHCGFSASVPHAPEVIRQRVHYVTMHEGGRGAVRELAESIMRAQGTWAAQLAPYADHALSR